MEHTHEVEWRQLTLGHLSRNKFWGEDPDTQYHSVVASSTLLRDGDTNILVDPTLPVEEMEKRLRRLCGLGREDIDIIFATHFHTDHRLDAEKYPNAKLYMSPESIQEIADVRREGGRMAEIFLNGAVFDFKAAPSQLTPGVSVQPLPGHTRGLSGLVFTSGGKRVLLAGDTIMNREFFKAREGYFIDASQEKTAASMNWAAQHVDIIVPGHGDWFFVGDETAALSWRKLNLCAGEEETVVLVQAGEENILINPALSGHLLREALFDARGLDPSQITQVICLRDDARHTLDLPVMKNARYYLPGWMMTEERQGRFEAWETAAEMPLEIVQTGENAVCMFESGGRKIAVACGGCEEQALRGADVAVLGKDVRIF